MWCVVKWQILSSQFLVFCFPAWLLSDIPAASQWGPSFAHLPSSLRHMDNVTCEGCAASIFVMLCPSNVCPRASAGVRPVVWVGKSPTQIPTYEEWESLGCLTAAPEAVSQFWSLQVCQPLLEGPGSQKACGRKLACLLVSLGLRLCHYSFDFPHTWLFSSCGNPRVCVIFLLDYTMLMNFSYRGTVNCITQSP